MTTGKMSKGLAENGTGTGEAVSVLFGPQGQVTTNTLLEIRALLHENTHLNFLSETISELPTLWRAILGAWPDLDRLPAEERLTELSQFFKGGPAPSFSEPADNILLCPLTVIAQIVEFWKSTHGIGDRSFIGSQLRDVQGFCLGFLTAVALSCSRNEAQYKSLASTAVRLAVCLGAVVDLNAVSDSGSRCGSASTMAVRWKSKAHWQHLQHTIERYPRAYLSCITGSQTATITIPESDLASVVSDLAERGMLTMPLAPRGRWHHQDNLQGLQAISALCERDDRFKFPNADALNNSLLSSIDGKPIRQGALHTIALKSILTEQARWDLMIDASANAMKAQNLDYRYLMIGEKVTIPRTVNGVPSAAGLSEGLPNGHGSHPEEHHVNGHVSTSNTDERTMQDDLLAALEDDSIPDNAIAIIGMACRYPEADSLEDFWDLINEGRCVIRQFPEERFKPSELARGPRGPFWGGYLREPDVFDHRFFGISGREAKSMDPQQRMALQVAYEAMESSGYCGLRSGDFDQEIGCYIGVANDDYDCNVASHPINAFSLTGTLRSYIAGRISHFFGWSGPSVTIDTACSASFVAIHTACRALQANDCTVALAGGVCAITSSRMTQNLIGATFLSPTGKSKAFDADADGYCRAEGAGLVVLRRLKDAVRQGDAILGVITGSAVNQASNTSSIQVPDTISQLALYQKALVESGTDPTDVTYVEAHGTGTQVGDPVELKSIRETFGGPHRSDEVFVGSVKDNIGHTEASSGAASLLKTIMMMHKKTIPKQANFKRLNPKMKPLGPDRVAIPIETREWKASKRIAMVNNYGASGNNAAMIVQDASSLSLALSPNTGVGRELSHFPIFISGKTPESVRSYCDHLGKFLSRTTSTRSLADIAYNLAMKQNRGFDNSLVLMSASTQDLSNQLEQAASGITEIPQKTKSPKSSVVLCFGGQDGKTAHISKGLYDECVLLQRHLADCESVCTNELSLPSLFPAIFDPEPIHNIVALHCVLFAIQYACAMSWLDCGLKVERMIGHSFGQLTALCVAGSLSLSDAIRLVSERARLVETHCTERGLMLAVEGSAEDIDSLLHHAAQNCPSADIACYNGPKNFVIAGDDTSITAIEKASEAFPTRFRMRRLENSHAFHSRLLDRITPGLLQTAGELHFGVPAIPIEACSNDDDWSTITAQKIARHTRQPVHFMHAVRKVEQQANGRVIWLEAGSGSPVIPMLKRAVHSPEKHVYIPTALRGPDAQVNLTKAVCLLWSNGVSAQFWPFHRCQMSSYGWINLPPYQFAKTRHWLEYKPAAPVWATSADMTTPVNLDQDLVRLCSDQPRLGEVLFEINPRHELYQLSTSGHEVVEQSLCPASLYIEFVLMASRMLSDAQSQTAVVPRIGDLTMSSPLVLNPVGRVFLKLSERDPHSHPRSWDFSLFTLDEQRSPDEPTTHGSGHITVSEAAVPPVISNLQSLSRLMLQRCKDIESSPSSIGFKGPTVYQAMRRVVTYVDYFQGIQSYYALGSESVARITLPSSRPANRGTSFCDPVLTDSFTQAGGVLANCFCIDEDGEMWICNYIGDIAYTRQFVESGREEGKVWTVYAECERPAPKKLRCNIFVFDAESGHLVLTIMAISFQKTSIKSLTKVLGKMNSRKAPLQDSIRAPINALVSAEATDASPVRWEADLSAGRTRTHAPDAALSRQPELPRKEVQMPTAATDVAQNRAEDSTQKVKEMLSDVLEIPLEEIPLGSSLEDLGIDSLLATEVFTEISKRFKMSVSHSDFATISDVNGLARLLGAARTGQPSTLASTRQSTSSSAPTQLSTSATSSPPLSTETVVYAERDGLSLSADIYYPNGLVDKQKPLPIALMIHGGGHVISTRRDIRDDQTQLLLQAGFLPVSVDYRLCPEVTLSEGPMLDVRDALAWARTTLPSLPLRCPDGTLIRADGTRVVAVGWSSGAHLAMSLGWTACTAGVRPPEAVLAFYGPSDYEDPFWTLPNLPFGHEAVPPPGPGYEHLYQGLHDLPVVGYSPNPALRALGGWMALDDPRSRIILHMNWEGKTLPVLLNGLRRTGEGKGVCSPASPSAEQIRAVSPLAQIRAGRYRTPTFLIHGTRDDLVPWQASRRTYEALYEEGVPAGLAILEDALHLFDIYPGSKRNADSVKAVRDGYDFLREHV
ncbi:hypothetical protein V8C42DRAFT_361770 [Trichoderma barbatum]